MKHLLVVPLLALFLPLPAASLQEEQNDPESVPALVKTLKEQRDNADVALVKKLASKQTRAAMEALLGLYDDMQSVYMRRAVCQGLALYDDVSGSEQPALEKLMNVAVESDARELRESAVELLGGCDNYGHAFLKMIVESSAADEVRERAMELHIASERPEDAEWYRRIFEQPDDETAKRKSKDAADETDKVSHRLPQVRRLAFEAIKDDLAEDELIEAAEDADKDVREIALREILRRDPKVALSIASDLWDKGTEPVPTRLVAAEILIRDQKEKVADDFIKEATKKTTPRELAFGLADLLVELDDDAVNKKLVKGLGKGKSEEKLFFVRATAKSGDPKVQKALIKLLEDKDPEVQRTAATVLGDRRESGAVEALEELIGESTEPVVLTAALDAITRIRSNDAEWELRLIGYCEDPEPLVRQAAIQAVGRTGNPDYLPVLGSALESDLWSTRLRAARALEEMRLEAGVGLLCERIGREEGRMARELRDILFRLTGKPFGTNGRQWSEWWTREGADFKIISESELLRIEREEEARKLKEISKTEFFGIRIESHRVIFILDVSGSMNDPTRGKYPGETGNSRMEVARSQLLKAVDGLDLNSLFNIVTFSSDVNAWRERIAVKTEATLEEAKGFIGRLGASGGTNLFGALEYAFEDPDVDTIYVLSDGEPSVGAITDGMTIRQEIGAWNKHRGVVLHCIAVGGEFEILEWLAEDSGGSYVQFP